VKEAVLAVQHLVLTAPVRTRSIESNRQHRAYRALSPQDLALGREKVPVECQALAVPERVGLPGEVGAHRDLQEEGLQTLR
jgi:hypothetical protein